MTISALSRPRALDPSSIDDPIRDMIEKAKESDKPGRLSIDIRYYIPDERQYRAWPGMSWKIECGRITIAQKLARGIDALMRALAHDADAAIDALEKIAAKGQ